MDLSSSTLDPDVVHHLLTFFSHGVFPIAYDLTVGHNHKLYLDILAQARYYSAPKLVAWLENACYYGAVSLRVAREPVLIGLCFKQNNECDTLQDHHYQRRGKVGNTLGQAGKKI
ncbi:hypothetical protein NKR19_g6236 [Coniochaeta hoffmannii]|uniref:Uncharacterized protein n=1 Tax=Coniochaeta hoffmannii TaxID=91930 RepID=A0AA38RYR4_9PEZI|nr:hypothetical protein NKR19_g6236 [Coniochaeta hoffmannii]